MLTKRIIPCLDVKDDKVVKGTQFRNHEIMGDIIELAKFYQEQGADELVFYDITASCQNRVVDSSWVTRVAQEISIPFCVAGGIRSVGDAQKILASGADKISINSPALERPDLINELASTFGRQCVVVGVDSYFDGENYIVRQYTGSEEFTKATTWLTLDWVREVQKRGAGEIVLNCMNQDGMRQGYDIKQIEHLRRYVNVPLIASGGAGSMQDFCDVFEVNVDGALAARVFHKREIKIPLLKCYLGLNNVPVRDNYLKHIKWDRASELIPAIVQDSQSLQVLMLGYMNSGALQKTIEDGLVTFYSRSKKRLWTKGESSGNFLKLIDIKLDCDSDALLVKAMPQGPACHLNTVSCFGNEATLDARIINKLADIIKERASAMSDNSYTVNLLQQGIMRIAQKVGEEGVELALAAVADPENLCEEMADLWYHCLVLLQASNYSLEDFLTVLKSRMP
jgi:imidazoleglycerol phosphate synthase cyclase subunit/phosphoribosyl-ATP pyrophosphohydrolase